MASGGAGVMLRWGLLVSGVVALTACTPRADRILFDGEFFRTKVSKVDRDARQNFTVEVPGVSRSFEGAREAGRYGATRYCIETYGTSDIIWGSGPDDDPESLQIERDRLLLRGTCLF